MISGNRFGRPTGVSEYKRQAVQTASPLELVLMLYSAGIRECELGIKACREKRLEEQHKHFTKAQRIISELAASLDMEKGGEIATNLFGLYSFCLNRLTEANINDDPKPAEESLKILSSLRESWQEIADNRREGTRDAT